jgi:hypothetical protein
MLRYRKLARLAYFPNLLLETPVDATGHVSVIVGRVIHVKGVLNKFITYQAFNRFLAGEVKKNSWMI